MTPSRRKVVGGAATLGVASAARPAAAAAGSDARWLQSVLERYAGFGDKASGGPGDEACGAWLEGELARAGYACSRQMFETPYFEPRQASLVCDAARAAVIPQAVVVATGASGVTGPLRRADSAGELAGAIALVVLPFKRWASIADPQAARPLVEALQRGAAGAVLVTTGPSGEAIALNVTSKRVVFDRPVAVLAPKDAPPFMSAAAEGRPATLTLDGRGGRRPAWNLLARLDRGAAKTVIVTTPRSGWFGCAAERGSGLAVWLDLARWLPRSTRGVNLEFAANSGHEYEFLGGEHYLEARAPKPAATKAWVHIGASAAARDWHELGGRLLPLPDADSQRVLIATKGFLAPVRRAFHGISGLEAAYLAEGAMAGGELVNVLRAGYPDAIGLYGAHRYFHTRADDLRCVSGDLVKPVADAFRNAILACLA